MVLSTPGTSGYRLSYKKVLRAVPHKPFHIGYQYNIINIFNRGYECLKQRAFRFHAGAGLMVRRRSCLPSGAWPALMDSAELRACEQFVRARTRFEVRLAEKPIRVLECEP